MGDEKPLDKSEEIRDLDDVGKKTLVALLAHKTKKAAAEALSVNQDTIYERIKRYGLDKVIAEIPKQALQTLQLGSERAAEVMVESLESRHDRMEAAKEVLDRVGIVVQKPTTLIQTNVSGDMSVEFTDK